MLRQNILDWIKLEVSPLTLPMSDTVILQKIENAIRYYNTHSAYKIYSMLDSVETKIVVPTRFKRVTKVYPSQIGIANNIMGDLPLWVYMGSTMRTNTSQDAIAFMESYKNTRLYFGADFAWRFIGNPDVSGEQYLLVQNIPARANRLYVEGTKRILAGEDIIEPHILDWLLHYSKALVFESMGRLLRKGAVVGISNDGDSYVSEAREDKKELEERLAIEGRWVIFGNRLGTGE